MFQPLFQRNIIKEMKSDNKKFRPLGAIGIYILNQKNQLLLLLRTSPHGRGTWCPPGGHIEYGESFLEAAKRETFEESGVLVKQIEVMGVTSNVFPQEKKHYVTAHVRAVKYSGQATLKEPDKFSQIDWVNLDKLPRNLFPTNLSFLRQNPLCLCGSGQRLKQCHGRKS